MSLSYAKQTLDAPNPFRRYSHQNRLKRSIVLALAHVSGDRILDYGCGDGAFVRAISDRHVFAVGYEPVMNERVASGLPIYRNICDFEDLKPFGLITLFETIEHMSDEEIDEFLEDSQKLLSSDGGILISAPIEIGPALLVKDLCRGAKGWRSIGSLCELLRAAIACLPCERAANIKTSHKGFDFRRMIKILKTKGWRVEALGYGPLPLHTWYGNSQIFLKAQRDTLKPIY